MHEKNHTSFNEESDNNPFVNDSVWFIFRWQKFKPAGFNEYSEVPGTVHRTITSKRLGWPDHIGWAHYWNCGLSTMVNKNAELWPEMLCNN